MEYIKKEELIEGEIYVFDNKFINKIQNGHLNIKCWISIPGEYFYKKSSNNQTNNIINATSEEKHWLNTCIKQDKFITFEEAMKTFIPEYYQYIGEIDSYKSSFIKGKTYKIINKNDLEASFNFIDEKGTPNGYEGVNWKKFKPSTKEAYDAQFVVIEPLPQFKVIETIETITKVENNEGNQFFIGDVVKTEAGLHFKIIGFKYNENKTKILAIATDNYPEVVKDINDIEHYIEPKVEETLLEKAKRLYPIGTKFRVACIPKYIGTVKDHKDYPFQDVDIVNLNTIENIDGCTGMTVFYKGKWAEIINE